MGIKRNDILWKGALEDFFADFLRLIFPNADEIFDFDRELVFLEQELAAIRFGNDLKHPKIIDKLAGAYLRSGGNIWIRVHVEVEKKARRGFGFRMFRYFYRIFDKYEVPVISIALFLEKSGKNNVPFYHYSFMGTRVNFCFNTICVADLDEKKLSESNNPFAKLLLIARLAIRENLSVQNIFDRKIHIARQLFNLDLPADRIRRLLDFLKTYVHFDDQAINDKFDEEIKLFTGKSGTMGITEQIIDLAKQEGETAGLLKGESLGLLKGKTEFVKNLLGHTSHSLEEIMRLADVPAEFVKKIKETRPRI